MEEAARRFARNVLIFHLFLLAAVVAVVIFAAREIHSSARSYALDQAREQQNLLVETTSSGIETFYTAILNNLELLRRAEFLTNLPADPAASGQTGLLANPLARALWAQIENRASHLLVVDQQGHILDHFHGEDALPADRIVQDPAMQRWLASVHDVVQQDPQRPAVVSPAVQIDAHRMNLVATPVPPRQEILLVAVVPMSGIESRFLNALNRPDTSVSAMLLDEAGRIMVHHDRRLLGQSIADLGDSALRQMVQHYMSSGQSGDEIFEQPVVLVEDSDPNRRVVLNPGFTRIEPLDIGGHRWWLVVSTGLERVNRVVGQTFRRAMVWAGCVIVAMTTILVSTSTQLIRGRSRLERARGELLAREISQAREIQLAWLPSQYVSRKQIDIAAVNHPASHISGDFYNWFELPDGRLGVTIGDVTGHGMSAAFLMATTQLLVRMTMMRLGDPGLALDEVNRQLCIQSNGGGQFVTMLIVVIDTERGVMDVATAGHHPPLLSDGEGFEPLKLSPQLVLGVEPDIHFVTQRFELPPQASLLLYTDGALDVVAPDGSRFEEEKLIWSLDDYGPVTRAQEIIDRVVETVTRFRGERELPDDLTLVAIHLQTAAAGRNAEMAAAGR